MQCPDAPEFMYSCENEDDEDAAKQACSYIHGEAFEDCHDAVS